MDRTQAKRDHGRRDCGPQGDVARASEPRCKPGPSGCARHQVTIRLCELAVGAAADSACARRLSTWLRNAHAEGCAAALFLLDPDPPAMRLGRKSTKRQTEPVTAGASGVVGQRDKALEDALLLVSWYSRPAIDHAHQQPVLVDHDL